MRGEEIRDRIQEATTYYRRKISEAERRVEELRKCLEAEISALQANCPHQDDGGMFHATCTWCGKV